MWRSKRSQTSLKTALSSLRELSAEAPSLEFRGMIESALLVTAGAYARKESRGAHFRTDYPDEAAGAPRHTYLTLRNADAVMESVAGGETRFIADSKTAA